MMGYTAAFLCVNKTVILRKKINSHQIIMAHMNMKTSVMVSSSLAPFGLFTVSSWNSKHQGHSSA